MESSLENPSLLSVDIFPIDDTGTSIGFYNPRFDLKCGANAPWAMHDLIIVEISSVSQAPRNLPPEFFLLLTGAINNDDKETYTHKYLEILEAKKRETSQLGPAIPRNQK